MLPENKKWFPYRDYLHKGDWQVHTSYTDGSNTVFEFCERAVKNNLELIAFTEHVRSELDYNFYSLISDIESARRMVSCCQLYEEDGK